MRTKCPYFSALFSIKIYLKNFSTKALNYSFYSSDKILVIPNKRIYWSMGWQTDCSKSCPIWIPFRVCYGRASLFRPCSMGYCWPSTQWFQNRRAKKTHLFEWVKFVKNKHEYFPIPFWIAKKMVNRRWLRIRDIKFFYF